MAYAAPFQSAPSRSFDRRKVGAFAMSGAIHILAILVLSWWQLAPAPDVATERVQAVALNEPEPPPPELEPEAAEITQSADSATAGGGDDQAPSAKIARDRPLLASVPAPIRSGLPLPRIPLARTTPASIGGGRGDAIGTGSRPGTGGGSGMGSGMGTGMGTGAGSGAGSGGEGTGESSGSPSRTLKTRWAPSMDFRRLAKFYPPSALAERLPGQVVLECTVISEDRVKDCIARAAGPVGRGFEEAAVKAQDTYRVQVIDQNGARVYNERILIRAYFRPELARR